MTPREVAAIFRVDPKTITRWANAGQLMPVKTPGGHNRFWESDVQFLMGERAARQAASWGRRRRRKPPQPEMSSQPEDLSS